MKVAFNGTALLSPWAGVGQYTAELAAQLVQHEGVEPEFFYGIGWSPAVRSAPLPGAGPWLALARRWVPFSYSLRRAMQNRRFGRHVRRSRFSLYHEPNFLPLDFDGPIVVTVHDLSWIRFPQTHPPERVRALDRHFQRGLARADRVITDSGHVRTELIETFGLPGEQVRAIPLAASEIFVPVPASVARPRLAPYGLQPGQFFLSVGTLEPRKNLPRVVQAYRSLPEPLQSRLPLVLVGNTGWSPGPLEQALRPLIANGRVRRLGYLPQPDLAIVTASALALVYPSLYEGFGLPPLEAMHCGVPPIVSTASSMSEVTGDAALQVDPADPQAIAAAMTRLAEDTSLRRRLGETGRARAASYSWRRCAGETIEVYRDLVGHT